MNPRRLAFFSAAILAALTAILTVALPAGIASAASVTAAGNRVWAISSAAHDHARADRLVSADQRLGEAASCPFCVPGACVAPEAATAGSDALAGGNAAVANPLGGTMNCVACSIAGDARLSGSPAVALNVGPKPISVLEQTFGGKFEPVSGPFQIGSILSKAGSGARGIVFGSRGTAVGHVWNAVNDSGVIRFPDFQSGMGASFDGYSSFYFLLTGGGG